MKNLERKKKIFDWKVFILLHIVIVGDKMSILNHPFALLLAVIPLLIVQLALLIYAAYDWYKQGSQLENRYVWLVLILVVNIIGPLVYFWKAPRDTLKII